MQPARLSRRANVLRMVPIATSAQRLKFGNRESSVVIIELKLTDTDEAPRLITVAGLTVRRIGHFEEPGL